MPMIPIPFNKPKQLLVEGREEELFFGGLLRHLELDDLQIQGYGGRDNLRLYLRTFVATAGFEQVQSIAVIRDADDSATSAFQSVQSSLNAVELPAPGEMLVPVGDSPRVAVFIMPGNGDSGALENLCLSALENDPAMRCVSDFVQCVQQSLSSPPQNLAKARIHAFLSSRQDPELRLGEAAQRGHLPWEAAAFQQLVIFLKTL